MKKIELRLTDEVIHTLHAGESVLLSGSILTGRDCAHKRIYEMLDAGTHLPFDYAGQTIYYAGPCPAPEGKACGSCGPTTSARMDAFAPRLLDTGLKGMIGKGERSDEVCASIVKNGAVYFAAVGGAGALLSKSIMHSEIIAYADLGTEAIRRLTVRDFPVIVVMDSQGNDLYQTALEQYRRE